MITALAMAMAAMPNEKGCAPRAGSITQIERTVRSFYAALEKENRKSFDRQLTGDFVSYDGGERFDGQQLFDLIAKAHRDGKVYHWKVGTMRVEVDCRAAWARWETRGESGLPGKMIPRHWFESATFRHGPTGWRMAFFHSTSAPAP